MYQKVKGGSKPAAGSEQSAAAGSVGTKAPGVFVIGYSVRGSIFGSLNPIQYWVVSQNGDPKSGRFVNKQ